MTMPGTRSSLSPEELSYRLLPLEDGLEALSGMAGGLLAPVTAACCPLNIDWGRLRDSDKELYRPVNKSCQ